MLWSPVAIEGSAEHHSMPVTAKSGTEAGRKRFCQKAKTPQSAGFSLRVQGHDQIWKTPVS